MKIATWNINGIKARLEGAVAWVADAKPDVVCFQEVNGQERPGNPRDVLALQDLLAGTSLAGANLVSTLTTAGEVFNERNLVVASTLAVQGSEQLHNDLVKAPMYKRLTAAPAAAAAVPIGVERPILHLRLNLNGSTLHVINVHLKSKIPSDIPGQKHDQYRWKTASGWAEGFFVSSLKRMSQALEVRRLVDQILDADADAYIVVAGDFNAEPDDVPVLAIRGEVEDTGNGDLAERVLVPIENTVPESSRYTLFHQGHGQMLDHLLVTRNLLANYRGAEIHNELLHDESAAFADDKEFPESDHAPVVATFEI